MLADKTSLLFDEVAMGLLIIKTRDFQKIHAADFGRLKILWLFKQDSHTDKRTPIAYLWSDAWTPNQRTVFLAFIASPLMSS